MAVERKAKAKSSSKPAAKKPASRKRSSRKAPAPIAAPAEPVDDGQKAAGGGLYRREIQTVTKAGRTRKIVDI